MKRAAELFRIDRRPGRAPYVEELWYARSEPEAHFISVAVSHWEMVVTRQAGTARMTVRGPETRATTSPIPPDAEFFGIRFALGTFLTCLQPWRLVDRALTLPSANGTTFRFGGSEWELPGPANADVFVDKLVRSGLLVHDPVPAAGLHGDVTGLSRRSVQRRISRATGLTGSTIRQIQRAEQAVDLLSHGMPVPDVAYAAGYADQPHLTRSLTRFMGQTPSQIAASARDASLR